MILTPGGQFGLAPWQFFWFTVALSSFSTIPDRTWRSSPRCSRWSCRTRSTACRIHLAAVSLAPVHGRQHYIATDELHGQAIARNRASRCRVSSATALFPASSDPAFIVSRCILPVGYGPMGGSRIPRCRDRALAGARARRRRSVRGTELSARRSFDASRRASDAPGAGSAGDRVAVAWGIPRRWSSPCSGPARRGDARSLNRVYPRRVRYVVGDARPTRPHRPARAGRASTDLLNPAVHGSSTPPPRRHRHIAPVPADPESPPDRLHLGHDRPPKGRCCRIRALPHQPDDRRHGLASGARRTAPPRPALLPLPRLGLARGWGGGGACS